MRFMPTYHYDRIRLRERMIGGALVLQPVKYPTLSVHKATSRQHSFDRGDPRMAEVAVVPDWTCVGFLTGGGSRMR